MYRNPENKLYEFQTVINQLINQLRLYKKEPPFDSERYQSEKGLGDNKNPMRKLTQEECEDLLLRVEWGMGLLKKYKRKSYIRGLKIFKLKALLNERCG